MRRGLILAVPVALVAAVGLFAVVGWGAGGDPAQGGGDPAQDASSLEARSVGAGPIEVTVDPISVDERAALFDVAFDTHSEELDLDVAEEAALQVGGVSWGPAVWEGDGPGGHHRGGLLRFVAGGPVAGSIQLSIGGLPAPVELAWTLGGG